MIDLTNDRDLTPRADAEYTDGRHGWLPRTLGWGLAVPPAAWIAHHQASYAMATLWCDGPTILLHALTIGLLALVAAHARRVWRQFGGRTGGAGEIEPSSARFLALVPLLQAAIFGAAIVAQGIPNFFLSPCH